MPSGAKTANITVTTSPVASGQSAVIAASANGASQSDTLTLTSSGQLSGIQCALPTASWIQIMGSAANAACTVTLVNAPVSAETIALTTNSSGLTLPASVSVAAGATSAKFTAKSGSLPALTIQHVTITASLNGDSETTMFTIAVLVSSLTCSRTAIMNPASTSTTCTIKLSQPAPVAAAVAVSDSSTNLTVPASVNVPAGASSAAFTATIGNPPYTVVTVSAALAGIEQSATVTVGPVPVKSLTCTPSALKAGKTSACTIALVGPAPAGGEPVTISASSGKLAVPSSATVAAGAVSVKFAVTALAGYSGPVQVTAKAGGVGASATISDAKLQTSNFGESPKTPAGKTSTAAAGDSPSSAPRLACAPHSVEPGGTVTCEVRFDASASGKGAEFSVSSSHRAVRVPATVSARANQTSLSFQAAVDASAPAQTVSITAALGSSTAEDRIVVLRGLRPVLIAPGKQRALVGSRLSFQISASSNSGVAPRLQAASLPQGASFDPSTGAFEWTPALSGKWTVVFSAADEAGRSASAQVAIQTGSGAPEIESLENAASGSTDSVCSSGSLASVRGEWLSDSPGNQAPAGVLDLAGTSVLVNGQSVPVVFASPTQIVFVCPSAPVGAELAVSVATANGASTPAMAIMRTSTPGIFTVDGTGRGNAAATILNGSRLAMPRNHRFPSQPAQAGDMLSIPMTGLPANAGSGSLIVKIGGVPVPADFVRPVPGAAGVSEIGVTIPRSAALGDSIPVSVELPVGGVSQAAQIAIEQ
jgi:uncharacterized protein (TIGR03437 family)